MFGALVWKMGLLCPKMCDGF